MDSTSKYSQWLRDQTEVNTTKVLECIEQESEIKYVGHQVYADLLHQNWENDNPRWRYGNRQEASTALTNIIS
jgi:hypothetical protein